MSNSPTNPEPTLTNSSSPSTDPRSGRHNRLLLGAVGLAAVAFVASGCRVTINGDDDVDLVSETFEIENFDELRVGGALTVDVEIGPEASMVVEAESDTMEDIEVKQSDGRLDIDMDGGFFSFNSSGPIRVRLTTPALDQIDIRGAVSVAVDGLETDSLDVRMEGASTIEASGSADNLRLTAEGASSADFKTLAVNEAVIDVEGASSVDLTNASRVEGSLSGASSVDISDDTSVDVSTSGASSIG